ncbi:protein CROWDED NUCLEI 4-like isoform X1 [Durio zibethinus]|uniref:Protein CROWDED NUCLEI 4-like isoform X1 n=2 Tax=Durio zibethinus TaxID=66656 RepID=A0A6P6BD85_DURZI|nr:protein CROWDED NUCLEI 4-like isoform X1 [Durio zibethinus]
MASPVTPCTSRALSITPGSRVLKSPLSDETIGRWLKEAGFDEESIKKRDKAALIAYIAKLEAELFDHQHHMGLLILKRKELDSKYEQIKASAEASEIMHKRDQAAHLSALAEAKKREDGLKKALGVEKECIASIEKALHEMRAESAETKVAAESRLAEARIMIEDTEKKFTEAEAKFHAAKSLEAEASLFRRTAERKLQEVEAREDDLSRHIVSFKNDCDAKEKEIILERQLLSERQKIVQQEHERLLDGQASLNRREEYIFSRTQELNQLEKELEASRVDIEKERRALKDEKSNLELVLASLSKREEAVIEREALLSKKEQQLLVSQEKLAIKESDEIRKVIDSHETVLRTRKSEFEAELEMKHKMAEDEIEMKRRAWELKEMDINQREDLICEREHDFEVQWRMLGEKEKDVAEKSSLIDEREKNLSAFEKELELEKAFLEKEKEEISKMKLELQKSLSSLEDKRIQVDCAKEKLEAMRSETRELSTLELKLKEELDLVRAQKLELMADADRLKIEKAKFETEWELIDEKREELRREAACVHEEREAVSKFLKDERDSLRRECGVMRKQHNKDVESLNCEREDFMRKMMLEHSDWFNKIQQERAEFLLGIETQKRELENCVEKRREELEGSLKEREEAFEQEKKNELQHINALKERAEKELEQTTLEMRRLDAERIEIKLDRERREREWAELNKSIEELKVQRHKLKQQRELLHADRNEIHAEIEELKKLGNLKAALDDMTVAKLQHSVIELYRQKASERKNLKQQTVLQNAGSGSDKNIVVADNGHGFNSPMSKPAGASPPSSARFSWIKRCSELIFKHSPNEAQIEPEERSLGLGEAKVIVEVSCEGEVVKGIHDLESEIKKNDSEKTLLVFEQGIQAGRKRRVDDSPASGAKKRRQKKDASVTEEEDITLSVCSAEPNASVDQPALMSYNQGEGGADETNVLIIDKIINISEVTYEKKTVDHDSSILGNGYHLQDIVAESVQDIPQSGEICGHPSATEGENGGYEEPGTVKEAQLGNFSQVTEPSQPMEDMSERNESEQKLEENFAPKPDDNEKIGMRTRRFKQL